MQSETVAQMRPGYVLYEQVEQILRIFGHVAADLVLRLEGEMAGDSRGGKAEIEREARGGRGWRHGGLEC